MARLASASLWTLLALGVVLVVAMTWHPWVHPWRGVLR